MKIIAGRLHPIVGRGGGGVKVKEDSHHVHGPGVFVVYVANLVIMGVCGGRLWILKRGRGEGGSKYSLLPRTPPLLLSSGNPKYILGT